MEEQQQEIEEDEPKSKYMILRHSEMYFGVPIASVLEVMPTTSTTPIPNGKSYMRGIMNLRGRIVTVIDLNPRLGVGKKIEPGPENAIVILQIEDVTIGIVVEEISMVISIKDSEIVPIDQIQNEIAAKHVNNMINLPDKMIMLLDIESLFDLKSMKKVV